MGRKFFISFILNVLLYSSVAYADTIDGPALMYDLGDWVNAGLQITALKDVTLESFVFQNQGNADTIWLTDSSGKILETYNYTGGDTSHFVDVAWELSANQSYHIIAHNSYNGIYSYVNKNFYPVSNDHIRVDGAWQIFLRTNTYWFDFNNITTVVPEPVSSILFVTGGGILAFRHFRKK